MDRDARTCACTETSTVNEVVAACPEASSLLSDLGIDTCCGGGAPLAEACADAQVNVHEVMLAVGRLRRSA